MVPASNTLCSFPAKFIGSQAENREKISNPKSNKLTKIKKHTQYEYIDERDKTRIYTTISIKNTSLSVKYSSTYHSTPTRTSCNSTTTHFLSGSHSQSSRRRIFFLFHFGSSCCWQYQTSCLGAV